MIADETGLRKIFWRGCRFTQTNLDSCCHGSILKTTPSPPGYSWVSGGCYVTPQLRFSGLVLNHQGLEELEIKKPRKNFCF